MRFSQKFRGFSLFEVLLVLTLIVLLFGLIQPSFRSFVERRKSETLLVELLAALTFARQEASALQQVVSFCLTREGGVVESDQVILHAFPFSSPQGRLHYAAFPDSQAALSFLPNGATQEENGSYWFCPRQAKYPAWTLRVNKAGRIQAVHPDSQGRVFDGRGRLLVC